MSEFSTEETILQHYRKLVAQNKESHKNIDDLVDKFLYIFYRLNVNKSREDSIGENMALIAMRILELSISRGEELFEEVEKQDFDFNLVNLNEFSKNNQHFGIWVSPGENSVHVASNLLSSIKQSLGGDVEVKATVPRIYPQTTEIFSKEMVNHSSLEDSIFGLLEAALEINFRVHLNEKNFTKGEKLTDFKPIIFFFDDINSICDYFVGVCDSELKIILDEFEKSLSGERLSFFQDFMSVEVCNYRGEISSKLLSLIWRVGCSLNIKSVITGRNLQASKLRVDKTDIFNCAYIALGKSLNSCIEHRVEVYQRESMKVKIKALNESQNNLKHALLCPIYSDSFMGYLP